MTEAGPNITALWHPSEPNCAFHRGNCGERVWKVVAGNGVGAGGRIQYAILEKEKEGSRYSTWVTAGCCGCCSEPRPTAANRFFIKHRNTARPDLSTWTNIKYVERNLPLVLKSPSFTRSNANTKYVTHVLKLAAKSMTRRTLLHTKGTVSKNRRTDERHVHHAVTRNDFACLMFQQDVQQLLLQVRTYLPLLYVCQIRSVD
jgi:hypothetical protein